MQIKVKPIKPRVNTYTAYLVSPLDFGWEYLTPVDDVIDKIAAEQKARGKDVFVTLHEFLLTWEEAQVLAREVGWEGDGASGAHVFFLPYEYCIQFGFVIKQNNNGSTFIISPIPLPDIGTIAQDEARYHYE